MKIVISILLFLAGVCAIGYSYIDAYASIGRDIAETAERGQEISAFNKAIDLIMSGALPQPTSVIYFGLLLIAISAVNLMGNGKRHDNADSV